MEILHHLSFEKSEHCLFAFISEELPQFGGSDEMRSKLAAKISTRSGIYG
jgi:hypothetical protein